MYSYTRIYLYYKKFYFKFIYSNSCIYQLLCLSL